MPGRRVGLMGNGNTLAGAEEPVENGRADSAMETAIVVPRAGKNRSFGWRRLGDDVAEPRELVWLMPAILFIVHGSLRS